jgi:ATP-dependent Clp protease adaptor protein ClpS
MRMTEAETTTRPEVLRRSQVLPPYAVILHNDDVNEMLYVVRSITQCVPGISIQQAIGIMWEAHNNGRAVVTVCPLELAELYRERLQSKGLTATIEKA